MPNLHWNLAPCDYLLKPVKIDKLKEVFRKIKNDYDIKIEQSIKIRQADNLLREQFLLRIAEGTVKDYSKLLKQAEELGVYLKYSYYAVAVIELDDYNALSHTSSSQDISLIKFSIKNIAEELCMKPGIGYAFDISHKEVGVIIGLNENNDECIRAAANEIKESVDINFKITTTFYISDICGDISNIAQCYKSARKMAALKFKLGGNKVIYTDDEPANDISLQNRLENYESKYLLLLQGNDIDALNHLIDEIFQGLRTKDEVYGEYYSIQKLLLRFAEKTGGEISEVLRNRILVLENPREQETINDIVDDLKNIGANVVNILSSRQFKNIHKVVEEVKVYVNANQKG